jgi:hypothetical protein
MAYVSSNTTFWCFVQNNFMENFILSLFDVFMMIFNLGILDNIETPILNSIHVNCELNWISS